MNKLPVRTLVVFALLLSIPFLNSCRGDERTTDDVGHTESREEHTEEGHDHEHGADETDHTDSQEAHAEEAGHEHDRDSEEEGHGDDSHIRMPDEALRANGVVIARAGAHTVRNEIPLPGEIVLNTDRVAHVVPRFPGIVLKVNKSLGDRVRAGEVLAVVQSNASAAPYEITALMDGRVIEKHVTLGEFVRDDMDIFVIADLSEVWVNINVYARFLSQVKVGQPVRITSSGQNEPATGKIDYIGPIIGETARTGIARMRLSNPAGTWQPGLFVTAHVIVGETRADVAVPESAIQTLDGQQVVFVRTNGAFEPRRIDSARSGGGWVEVTSGLAAGEEFVTQSSFIFKAELGKGEAGHDH